MGPAPFSPENSLAHYWPTADPLRTLYSPFAKNALANDFSVETDSESESRAMPPRQSLSALRKAPEPQPAARQMGAVCAVQKECFGVTGWELPAVRSLFPASARTARVMDG